MPNDMTRFEVNMQPHGVGNQILLNGDDVSEKVVGCQITTRMGELTTILIELAGSGRVTGTGYVENIDMPDAAVAVGMLDPEEVEQRTLQKLDWGDGQGNMTAMLLQTIVEMLDEVESQRGAKSN